MASLTGGDDVGVVVGEPGSGWFWSPSQRMISADGSDVLNRSQECCQGIMLHELGHALMTRYSEFVPKRWLADQRMAALLNIVEDARMERWVASFLPGGAGWIAQANQELILDQAGPKPQSSVGEFFHGLLRLLYFGNIPNDLSTPVQDALVAASPILAKILELQPLRASDGLGDLIHKAYCMHMASTIWIVRDIRRKPSDFEKSVRMTQVDMWNEVHGRLWPLLGSLICKDEESGMTKDEWLDALLELLKKNGEGLESDCGSEPKSECVLELKLDRSLEAQEIFPGTGDLWDDLRIRQGSAIDQLSKELLQFRERAQRRNLSLGHLCGVRPDLRAVVRAQADPRQWDHVWLRRTVPHRVDPVVVLLVDRSGSMKNDGRAQNALAGIVTVAEACLASAIALEIWTFAQEPKQLMSYRDDLDPQSRRHIEGYVTSCAGGTDMDRAMNKMETVIDHLPYRDRIFLTISDGDVDSDDLGSIRGHLEGMRCRGTICLGLGVGKETRSLGRVFPGCPCDIAPERIGVELSAALLNAASELEH